MVDNTPAQSDIATGACAGEVLCEKYSVIMTQPGQTAVDAISPLTALSCPEGDTGPSEAGMTTLGNQLVLENLPLVRKIAGQLRGRLPVNVSLDDLIQSGALGLMAAARNFDPNTNVAFGSYARHRIRGSILDSLRQLDPASRDVRRRYKRIQIATQELTILLERAPLEAELAEKLGMAVEQLRLLRLETPIRLESASSRAGDDEELPRPELRGNVEMRPDFMCANAELRTVLQFAIAALPARYQTVITLYYDGQMTMGEIGKMLGVNESRVSQMRKSAMKRMAIVLQARGISSSRSV